MLDQSLLQSHFIGRDGFRWWIGQIPPIESMSDQVNGDGWGNRFKVRILGYHPYSEAQLKNEDLPWAQVLLPTTSGSGAANCSTGVQLQPGDTVLGFFLDGDNAQIPVILATFGRTSSVPSLTYQSPFVPFTGYSSKITPNSGVTKNEVNQVTTSSNPSPQDVTTAQAAALSQATGQQVIPTSVAIGDIIPLANTVENTKISRIKAIVTNLVNKLKAFQDNVQRISYEISNAVDKITILMNEYIGIFMNKLILYLRDILRQGVDLLYQKVYAAVFAATGSNIAAHLAGVAAQKAMVFPVKLLEDAFACVAGAVIDKIGDLIENILMSTIGNIDRFVSCVSDQFVGSLLNNVIDIIESFMISPLGGVAKLLQFFTGFNTGDFLRSIVDGLAASGAFFDCNQALSNFTGVINEWMIGVGLADSGQNPYENIKNIINGNVLGECFAGALQFASPPTINIFGGIGSGATAVPIFGNLVVDSNGNTTASIIGVQITNPGSGYTFPPFVEIIDDNQQGYGAIARSIINNKGEVEKIYIVSEGENYSVGNIDQYSIVDIFIEDGGNSYVDISITDNKGNKYSAELLNGKVHKVFPINNGKTISPIPIDYLPIFNISSNTGSGAILRPILASLKDSKNIKTADNIKTIPGEIKTVTTSIDCPT